MDRLVVREKLNQSTDFFERIKIGVVPLSQGAGATFVATSMAKILSESENVKISYVEVSKGKEAGEKLIYDSLGMDKKFAGRQFIDFYQRVVSGESTRGMTNVDEGINWILHTPGTCGTNKVVGEIKKESGPLENIKIINNAPGDIIICDFDLTREMMELSTDMEVLMIVIDPMPSALIGGFEFLSNFKALEEKGKKVCWIVNKYNDGVNRRELLQYIKIRELHYLPFIAAEELYTAEYNCMLPISSRKIRSQLEAPLNKIIESIFV